MSISAKIHKEPYFMQPERSKIMDNKEKNNNISDDYIDSHIGDTDDTGDILDDITSEETTTEEQPIINNEDPVSETEKETSDTIKDTEFSGAPSGFMEKLKNIKTELIEQYKEIYSEYKEERKYRKRERRKEFYGGKPPKNKKARTLYITLYTIKKFFSLIATALFSLFLVFILTGTIVGTTITVYLLNFMDSTPSVVLDEFQQSFSSYIYQMNKETSEYELVYKAALDSHEVRLATDINELPDHVKYAFVCIEDERFYSHEGVDYKRTGLAIANLVLNKIGLSHDYFGGSTITQQLIKNVTGDDEDSWERKMREIFTAMKFEKNYTKDEILEAYLNEIYFSSIDTYHMYGIEAAAIGYFGKSASELTIAEAAVLAAIPKAPNAYNPTVYYEDNEYRKNYCLRKMFELGVISTDEYEQAINEKIYLSTMPEFKAKFPNAKKLTESDDDFQNPEINSWAVDAAIFEFADYLVETYDLEERVDGINMFNSGGYKLYISVDTDIQQHLDQKFEDWYYFPEALSDADPEIYSEEQRRVQAALAVMDYEGHILGVTGRIGPKTSNLQFINSYQTHRQPGSAIKPVTTYGYAIENDLMTYSSYFYDRALPAGVATDEPWPNNYDGAPSGGYYPVNYFLKNSINTLPAQIAYNYGLQNVFDFATQKLHLDLDPDKDVNYAPLCVGGTSTGPSMINLANAYIPYGNGGNYYKASMLRKVIDCKTGETIIDNENRAPERAVSEETAYIMNKLLQKVVSAGTGTAAQCWNTTVAGKTGTTENWRDITFVGLTPDYVSALWIGYDVGENWRAIEGSNSAAIWKNVFGNYANDHASGNTFPECDTIITARYCSYTGKIATSRCPGGDIGYYKSTDEYCSYH